VERDNKDQKLIKLEWVREAEILVEEGDLKERIKRQQKGSESSRRAKEGRNKDIERRRMGNRR